MVVNVWFLFLEIFMERLFEGNDYWYNGFREKKNLCVFLIDNNICNLILLDLNNYFVFLRI